MSRRLLLILLAVTQLAALPVTISPPTAEIGTPLIVSITLPDATTELVGFPDLGSFALLAPPERIGSNITLRLLPLRPGSQSLPALSFRTGQQLEATEPVYLNVAAPPTPARPHPLRPFPEPAQELQKRPDYLLLTLAAGFAIMGLALAIFRRQRHIQVTQPAPGLDDQFAQLAVAVSLIDDIDRPEWQRFYRQLEKTRFAPLSRSQEQLQALTSEFTRLRGELS